MESVYATILKTGSKICTCFSGPKSVAPAAAALLPFAAEFESPAGTELALGVELGVAAAELPVGAEVVGAFAAPAAVLFPHATTAIDAPAKRNAIAILSFMRVSV